MHVGVFSDHFEFYTGTVLREWRNIVMECVYIYEHVESNIDMPFQRPPYEALSST